MPTTQKLGIDSCDRDFVLLEELHRSAGGSVYRAKHKSSGTEVVIKERISAELGGKGRDAMRHELKLYERLPPHPNVIGLLGAFWRGGDAASSSAGYGASGAMRPTPHAPRPAPRPTLTPHPHTARPTVTLHPHATRSPAPAALSWMPLTNPEPHPRPRQARCHTARGWRWSSSTRSKATCTATSRPSARRAST